MSIGELEKRRREIVDGWHTKERAKVIAEQEKNRPLSELDDALTLVLQKWSFTELLDYMQRYVVRVMQHRSDPLEFNEARFAEDTLMECGDEREVSFVCYCDEVCCSARHFVAASECQAEAGIQYYVTMLRACFLIALVHDTRVQQFVMGRHHINFSVLRCRPPGRLKVNAYIAAIKPHIDDCLCRRTPLFYMYECAMQVWHSEQFAMRRFSEQPFLYGPTGGAGAHHEHKNRHDNENNNNNNNNVDGNYTRSDIPHNCHPQISSTVSRTSCDLSLVDELGY